MCWLLLKSSLAPYLLSLCYCSLIVFVDYLCDPRVKKLNRPEYPEEEAREKTLRTTQTHVHSTVHACTIPGKACIFLYID